MYRSNRPKKVRTLLGHVVRWWVLAASVGGERVANAAGRAHATQRHMEAGVTGGFRGHRGLRLAEWWPYACRRWPVDTAVRSEQLTVCRVRYGPELYGKIIRIDDDPPTLFVGRSWSYVAPSCCSWCSSRA